MALLGNYNVYARHPGRDIGGGATGLGYNRADCNKPSMSRAAFSNPTWDAKSSIPDGARPPHSWILAQTGGGLSSRNIIEGTGALSASGALGKNALADLAGSGALSATGALIVSAVADLVGSGSITTATLLAILQVAADLTGSGTLAADVDALGWILADLEGTGALTAPNYGVGHMEADILPYTELSPAALASAVWSAVAADNNESGTMGEKLNDAGSASNPWTETIEGTYTAAELLRIMAAALAGELSGAATTTITIKGVDGTTDRIVATVTSDGDRTAIALDGG
jgi:hypothetical protein